jgi:hypothetical protein
MAYTPYPYQPNYFGNPYPYQQNQQPMMQQPQQMPQQMQPQPRPAIQQSGFMQVGSMDDVYSWPVAPGNSITFYVETEPPVLASKTKGFSQLENPVIKIFDLHERHGKPQEAQIGPQSGEQAEKAPGIDYALKSDVDALRAELEAVKAKLKARAAKRQREVIEDDDE